MEFLCLNCFATFEVSEDHLPEPGGMLKCPVCGHEQPFAGVKTASAGTTRSKPVRTTTNTQRRASGEYRFIPKKTPTVPPPVGEPIRQTKKQTAVERDGESVKYRVVSPSNLSFEFSDLNVLIRWGEMVANPSPYKVYEGDSDEPVSLQQILEEKSSTSKIRRRTSKLKEAAEAELAARGEVEPVDSIESDDDDTKNTVPTVRSTKQFKFKTEVVEEKKWPMIVLYMVLAALFGAAALFAFYVYVLHGSGN